MGTPEYSVLNTVWNRSMNIEDKSEIESWRRRLCSCFVDIQQGLVSPNKREDADHFRFILAATLLSKTLSSDESLTITMPIFQDKFALLSSHFPSLTWAEYFPTVAVLGVGPELANMLSALDPEVQTVVVKMMKHWCENILKKSAVKPLKNRSHDFECVAFVISFYIGLELNQKYFENTKSTFEDTEYILKLFLQCFSDLSFKNSIGSEIFHENCFVSMLAHLRSIVVNSRATTSEKLLYLNVPDVFFLNDLPHILSASCIQNIENDGNCKQLLEDLTKLTLHSERKSKSVSLEDFKSGPPAFSSCFTHAKKLVDFFHDEYMKKGIKKNACICTQLSDILSLFEISEQEAEFLDKKEDLDLEKKLFIVNHYLKGYESVLLSLLNEMIEDPTKNCYWKDVFQCLEKRPDCLALKSILLIIAKGILKCISNGSECAEYTSVAKNFQGLFWAGFHLLTLESKMDITKHVLCQRDMSLLLAEYPMESLEKNAKNIQLFKLNQNKKVALFFDGLIRAKSITDAVIEKFCEICLLTPNATIKKLIEQAIRNEQQSALAIELLFRFNYLIDFKDEESNESVLWTNFQTCMKSLWKKSELGSIENALSFLSSLLQSDAIVGEQSYQNLVKEVFEAISVNLKFDEQESHSSEGGRLHKKLVLKLLFCFIKIQNIFEALTLEELIVFCLSLGGQLDELSDFSEMDSHLDEEAYVVLIDSLDVIIKTVVERMKILKETDTSNYEKLLNWIFETISFFSWMTQINFLPLYKIQDDRRIPVPACLSEVCNLPDVLQPCEDISYGAGGGLLAWHQCFIVDPSLCPLTSLDIGDLTLDDIIYFSNGWIVSLAQVLPYTYPNDWYTLTEATKILISEYKLHVPLSVKHTMSLPNIDLRECFVMLSVVQVLTQVFDLLGVNFDSTPPHIWLHLSKCYCMVTSSLINDSAEFDRASVDSKAFMLSQIYREACDVTLRLHNSHKQDWVRKFAENVFVLLLDVLGTFEKICDKLEDVSDLSKSTDSSASFDSESELSHQRSVLETMNRLHEMLSISSHFPNKDNSTTLIQKLSAMLDLLKNH